VICGGKADGVAMSSAVHWLAPPPPPRALLSCYYPAQSAQSNRVLVPSQRNHDGLPRTDTEVLCLDSVDVADKYVSGMFDV
jgi:hypothetical protein